MQGGEDERLEEKEEQAPPEKQQAGPPQPQPQPQTAMARYPGSIDYNADGKEEEYPVVADDRIDAAHDGDELLAYHGLARNDHDRVVAGTLERTSQVGKFFQEEIDERENIEWWGAHE